jgi:hypothetical protein
MAKSKPAPASTSVSASGKPKNFRIVHAGMAFPVGSVVPRALFPKPDAHLHIGSISETTEPVNVEVPAALLVSTASPTDTNEASISTQALRDELATMAGKYSDLSQKFDEATERISELEAELEAAEAQRDDWKAKAEFQEKVAVEENPDSQPPIQLKP